MGYGIITMKKISGGLGGIAKHIYRDGKSKSSPDIDVSRSAENFSLLDGDPDPQLEKKFRERVAQLSGQKTKTGKQRKIQKNAVKLCDFVVTASPEELAKMTPDDQDGFFLMSLRYLEERYGKENIIYAQVHLDEATPHLHVGLVPVIKDKLCAKELFTKQEMKALQEDFYANVSSVYDFEKPLGGRKGLSVLRYKAEQAQKQAKQAAKHAFYEAAPGRVKEYIKGAVQNCIENDLTSKNEYAKDAAATLKYIRDSGPEEWKNDWEYMSVADKDEKRLKSAYRDDY